MVRSVYIPKVIGVKHSLFNILVSKSKNIMVEQLNLDYHFNPPHHRLPPF